MAEEEEISCTKKKCKAEKNPCAICLRTCKPKNAMQCTGACQSWVHYKCASLSRGKILDIKEGTLEITCPCPDCKSALPKEIRRDDTVFACSNVKCPANNPPCCDMENCQANVAIRRNPKRCPPPGSLRKCDQGVCRIFSEKTEDIVYNYDESCDVRCTYKNSKKNCYTSPTHSQSSTSKSSDAYSCALNPSTPCCEIELMPEKLERIKRKDNIPELGKACRHQKKDQDYYERCESDSTDSCGRRNRRRMEASDCCDDDDDDEYNEEDGYDSQNMADEMMNMCRTVIDLEHRIECMLSKLIKLQQPSGRNRRFHVNIAMVSRGTGGLPDLKQKKTLIQQRENDKRELSYYLREMYIPMYKKLLIVVSVLISKTLKE